MSTRDCSLQRRHQKLVEEAPAPFLTDEQLARLYASSKAILKEAGYYNAGTCEFLVGTDGTISFLEVNTRLQVEHPVTEEVAGIDLVREQFRIAEGGTIDYDDPVLRGHSFEFRINGEDPGRGFLPAPGVAVRLEAAERPGRAASTPGFEAGDVIGGNFDSLLAKLIVTGATREEALERSRRALDEFEVDGMATALPFHRAVVRDPAFAPGARAAASPCTPAGSRPSSTTRSRPTPARRTRWSSRPRARRSSSRSAASARGHPARRARRIGGGARGRGAEEAQGRGKKAGSGATGDSLVAPMQGTIVKVEVEEGQEVAEGDLIVVLEAMKMEQPLTAHKAGTIEKLTAEVGATVPTGTVLCEIKG